ncbi:hypothetical protein KP509_19G002000 [Ceratopteris richardii]|uniref:Uncharacterized protein n=1 Tax=Ceratopteris richardii TaxID=49495 RepID=A0A8T2SJB0_CERRI|nr:hypothetical protein KP509_19G002000 [Ceratopteris richardii]
MELELVEPILEVGEEIHVVVSLEEDVARKGDGMLPGVAHFNFASLAGSFFLGVVAAQIEIVAIEVEVVHNRSKCQLVRLEHAQCKAAASITCRGCADHGKIHLDPKGSHLSSLITQGCSQPHHFSFTTSLVIYHSPIHLDSSFLSLITDH